MSDATWANQIHSFYGTTPYDDTGTSIGGSSTSSTGSTGSSTGVRDNI
jgi:hypothetical protein